MSIEKIIITWISRIEKYGTALSFLLFPVLFISAQLMHPHLFRIDPVKDGAQWITHFRGQYLLHLAHFFEFICAPLLIIMSMHYKKELGKKSPLLIFTGTVFAFVGALMLLGNKSALCLTISAFDTLNDTQIFQLVPGLNALLNKEGFMPALMLLPLLPLGYVLTGIALFRSRYVPAWQSILLITGSLMLANPEIETINFFASIFLAAGLIPYSIRLFNSVKSEE